MQFALVSEDAPYRELEDYARDLKDTLKTLDGVRTSETWAYPARELRVALDLPRMAELKLAPGRVLQALQSENANIPGGSIDVGSRTLQPQDVRQLRNRSTRCATPSLPSPTDAACAFATSPK